MSRAELQYRQLTPKDIAPDMLRDFNRYQEVTKSWRKQNGAWLLVDNPHIIQWDDAKKQALIADFKQILHSGGVLFAAYDGEKLAGFGGMDGNFIGSVGQYLWLVVLHVSYEYRGCGIGRALFRMIADNARQRGAPKLYISANSSQESQGFYRAVGCVHTSEIIPALFEAEPFDVHMEFGL